MTEQELSKKIDELINQLKKDLLNVPYNSRGLWDRVKNWWQNLTKTPENPANPYYLTNKFGSLGRINNNPNPNPVPDEEDSQEKEEEIPTEDEFKLGVAKEHMSLNDYKILKEEFSKLDEKVSYLINENYSSDNLKNLEMFRIIDNWGINFKKQIMNLLRGQVKESPADSDKKTSEKETTEKTKSPTTSDKILFKEWIRKVDNIHLFIEMVNQIFSDPVRYRKPIRSTAEALKSRGVLAPKKDEIGTPLDISIRNEILRMINKELEMSVKQEDSIFKPAIWNWARNLESMKKAKKADDKSSDEKEVSGETEGPTAKASDFEEEPASGEFLDI